MDPLRKIANDMEALTEDYSSRLWSQYTTGFDFGVQESLEKINDFQKDSDRFKVITQAMEKAQSPLELREAQILYKEFRKFHGSEKSNRLIDEIQNLENRLMDLLNKNRVILDGLERTSNEIGDILSKSPDRELRRRAYESRISLNGILVDAGFIKLLDLRKELALDLGEEDFVSYRLSEDDLDKNIFRGWSEIVVSRSSRYQQIRKKLGQEFLQIEELRPWDLAYLRGAMSAYNNATVDLSRFFDPMANVFAKFGFDIRALNLTFDIFPRKNKSEWGYNFTIKMGKDSRILANVTNMFRDFWVLLHETAHGVHFLGLNSDGGVLNHGVSGIVAEGFANFMGDQVYSREFLSEVFPLNEVETAYNQLKSVQRLNNLNNFASIEQCLFDQGLYLRNINSLADINDLKAQNSRDLLGEELYLEVPWAYVIHHTAAPVYFHNYFLGDVMSEKMRKVYAHKSGKTAESDPAGFGDFWRKDVLDLSGRYPFQELYERVCGEKLDIGDFLDQKVLAQS